MVGGKDPSSPFIFVYRISGSQLLHILLLRTVYRLLFLQFIASQKLTAQSNPKLAIHDKNIKYIKSVGVCRDK